MLIKDKKKVQYQLKLYDSQLKMIYFQELH